MGDKRIIMLFINKQKIIKDGWMLHRCYCFFKLRIRSGQITTVLHTI